MTDIRLVVETDAACFEHGARELSGQEIAALASRFAADIGKHLADGALGAKAMAALSAALTPSEMAKLLSNVANNLVQGLL